LRQYTSLGLGYCAIFAVSPTNPNLIVMGDRGLSPTTLYSYDVSTDPPTLLQSKRNAGDAGNLRDLEVARDGADVLMASGAPYAVQALSLATEFSLSMSYPTGPYPNAVAMTSDGLFVAAGRDASYDPDVYVFDDSSGSVVKSYELGYGLTLHSGGLAFSADKSELFAVSPRARRPAMCSSGFSDVSAC
jgi:hypothetical protein